MYMKSLKDHTQPEFSCLDPTLMYETVKNSVKSIKG